MLQVVGRPSDIKDHARRIVRRHGVRGTARRVIGRARPRRREETEFVWYVLDLSREDRPHRPLEEGLVFRSGGVEDLPILMQMETHFEVSAASESLVRLRVEEGSTPWLVLDGDQLLFSCWTLRGNIPIGGLARLELPEGVMGLEDSIAAPAARGRGIAPATWALVADRLAADGQRWMITKISTENRPSRVAIEKAGWVEAARMRLVRRDWRTVIRIALPPGETQHEWIRQVERG
jgi:hypothetical protein